MECAALRCGRKAAFGHIATGKTATGDMRMTVGAGRRGRENAHPTL
jgi:hypothetical protein